MLADPVIIAQYLGTSGGAADATSGAHAGPPAEPRDHAEAVQDLLVNGIPTKTDDDSVPLHIDDLLRYAVSVGASDLHLTAAMPGTIRLHGAMRADRGLPAARQRGRSGT